MHDSIDLKGRRNARKHSIQAIYQWQLTQFSIREIEQQFQDDYLGKRVDTAYFQTLLHEVPTNITQIDAAITTHVSRPMQDIDPIELAVLRLATFELLFRVEIPHQVVINEALELAKTFGSQDSHRFVNGVLDKVARIARPIEFSSAFKN